MFFSSFEEETSMLTLVAIVWLLSAYFHVADGVLCLPHGAMVKHVVCDSGICCSYLLSLRQ